MSEEPRHLLIARPPTSERQRLTDMLSKGFCLGMATMLTCQALTDELTGMSPFGLSWVTIGLVLAQAVIWFVTLRNLRKLPK